MASKSQGKHVKNSNNYNAGNGVSGTSATQSDSASDFDRAAVRAESGFVGANGGRATSVLPPAAKGAAYGDGQVYASDFPEYASAYGNPGGAGMGAVNSAGQFDMVEPKKKRNTGKILGIVFGSIAGVLLLAYIIGIVIFSNLFYPGTSIGSIDASMKSNADVKQELESAVSNYKLTVSGDGFSYTIDTAQADVSIDADAIVSQMHESLPAWQWPYLLTKSQHALTDLFVTSYAGSSSLNSAIKAKVDEFNATATEPQNASIVYDSTKKQFIVKEEVAGTQLDADAVTKLVDQAILSFQSKATLGSDQLLKPTVLSTDERLKTAADTASRMVNLSISLKMSDNDAGTINADQISQWIKLGDDCSVSLDEGAMNSYIDELESKLDTVGTERTYTRPDGKVITVSGGVYGWEVDGDSLRSSIVEAVNSGTSQTIDIPCTSTGDVYTGAGQKDWGNRYIDVDLAEQHVRMYDSSGTLIWESDCISGIPDGTHDTSVGVFWLNSKASPSKLIGYENGQKIYESTVRYWMPFDGNAIGLHDADWQPGFGGTMYADGYGSHGCVNLPVSAAAELYELTQEGDCVVSHW